MRDSLAATALVGVALTVALTSCTTPDTSPVPTTAEPPWACDGVPRTSVELLMGGPIAVDQGGGWEGSTMVCTIHGARGGGSSMTVTWDSTRGRSGGDEIAAAVGGLEGAEEVISPAPGSGFVKEREDGAVAWWVCESTMVIVRPGLVDVDGRNLVDDTRNLLVSILPWACDGEPVPSADTSP